MALIPGRALIEIGSPRRRIRLSLGRIDAVPHTFTRHGDDGSPRKLFSDGAQLRAAITGQPLEVEPSDRPEFVMALLLAGESPATATLDAAHVDREALRVAVLGALTRR